MANLDPCEIYKIRFKGKTYPVVDFQAAEPEVGIFHGVFVFCPDNVSEEGYTCDLGEDSNNVVNVYKTNGKLHKEKAEIVRVK